MVFNVILTVEQIQALLKPNKIDVLDRLLIWSCDLYILNIIGENLMIKKKGNFLFIFNS